MFFNKKTLIILIFSLIPQFSANAGDLVEDGLIMTSVKAALVSQHDVPAGKINVEVDSRIVKLSGVVDTSLQAETAVKIAMSSENVLDVDSSDLKLSTGEHPLRDVLLTAKAKGKIASLMVQANLASHDSIQVETKNSVVHLKGSVVGVKDRELIIDSIKAIRGVKEVKSNIDIR